MDAKTLSNLETAFKAAPSSELAKVIVLAQLELGATEGLLDYLGHLELPLEQVDALPIGQGLLERGHHQAVIDLMDREVPAQAVLLARSLLALGKDQEAKDVYAAAVEQAPAVQSEELNVRWGYHGGARPRLRVVERPDEDAVADLTKYRQETTSFDDVVGLTHIKKQISKKIILPFQKPSLYQRFRKKVGGGVLLFGPPGCGKTLLARATAGECNAEFYSIMASDVLNLYIGESEENLHGIFEKARESVPCVLFFDELEALAGKREHSRNANMNLVSQFLAEMDGFAQNNSGVLVLASTNVPWSIDGAFLRPGRFDRMLFVPPPDEVARAAILAHHMRERPSDGATNYKLLATKTRGFSGADLYNLVEMAADEAIEESIEANREIEIQPSHFYHAIQDCRPTTTEWLTTAKNYARYANDGGRYNDVLSFLKAHGK